MARKKIRKAPTKPHKPTRARVWNKAFLFSLADSGVVSTACKAAKIDRTTAYEYKEKHPAFAKLWDDALEIATDALLTEARRRAKDGTKKPVWQGGKKMGTVTEYSDNLMIALLKAHRPHMFRDNVQHEHKGEVGISLTDLRASKKRVEKKQKEIENDPALTGRVR